MQKEELEKDTFSDLRNFIASVLPPLPPTFVRLLSLALTVSSVVYHLLLSLLKPTLVVLRNRFLWISALISTAGLAIAGVLLNLPTGSAHQRDIIIERGITAGEIGRMLEKEMLIRSPLFFSIVAKVKGVEGQIEAGRHKLSGSMSTLSILKSLLSGQAITKDVTIPEGLTRRQIAEILKHNMRVDSLKFLSLTEDSLFCRELGIEAPDLEGYLFPDTYNFSPNTDERLIIKRMVKRFKEVFTDSLRRRAEELGFSIHEAVTLASIIEKEAQVSEERSIISAVFHQRLRMGRALEADPTVEYALGKHKGRILEKDLRVNSPYNTYLHPGLPPGPIANPGRASILAALYPADVDYLYFVAKGDGTHIFTKSNREHINAKNRLRKARR